MGPVSAQPSDPSVGRIPMSDGTGAMPAWGTDSPARTDETASSPAQEASSAPPPYPTGPYPTGPYPGAPLAHTEQNGLGLAAMICGIIGAVLGLFAVGIVPAVLGIVFGSIGLARARRGVASNRGQALTGVITGSIGVALFALIVSLVAVTGSSTASSCGAGTGQGGVASGCGSRPPGPSPATSATPPRTPSPAR